MRTVTFTMEDALISPIGLSILTGAGLIEASEGHKVIQHIAEQTSAIEKYVALKAVNTDPDVNNVFAFIDQKPHLVEDPSIYVMILDDHGEVQTEPYLFTGINLGSDSNVDPVEWNENKNGYTLDDDGDITEAAFLGLEAAGKTGDIYNIVVYGPGSTDKKLGTVVKENAKYAGKYPIIFKTTAYKYGAAKVQQTYYDEKTNSDSKKPSDYTTYKTVGGQSVIDEINYSKSELTLMGTATRTDTKAILVDYYTAHESGAFEINITPDKFGGTYYLEASTLWRDQATGQDLPAEFIIPNCKVQSNFSFTLSSSGDPSSFTFTMDAFPDYTRWDPTEKVFATIQVLGASTTGVNEVYREQTWASDEYEPIGGIIQGANGDSNS